MAAARVDIKLEQGTSWRWQLDYFENGAGVDLTGYTARMMVRDQDHDGAVVLSFTTENGRITLSAGRIVIELNAADSDGLDFDSGVYDLELVAPNGTVTRLMEGQVKLSRQVTR